MEEKRTIPAYDENPYNPAFGTEPQAYIHRYDVETQILNRFCAKNAAARSYMIMGARGTGKAVLMHEMANRFASFDDWAVVRMNPNVDMLDSLMRKLSGHKKIAPMIKEAKINLGFFGLTLEKQSDPIMDTEDAIAEIVRQMKANDRRLLIIVDEATNTQSMKAFVSAYQNLIGQKLPVYLLMTGLYEKINNLKNEDNLTFLYRMPRIFLEPLELTEIAANYRDVFQMKEENAWRMAAMTRGYSYAFQLLGELTWENGGDYDAVLDEYRRELYDVVYDKMWDETSATDREILYGIATTEGGRVRDIREKTGRQPNEFSPYSDRLRKKGVAYSGRRGTLEIALPFFKGYIIEHHKSRLMEDYLIDLPADL